MSRQTIFTAGSLAKAYIEVADWYGKHAEEIRAKKILVPFSGFGRLASAMCRDDTTMYVCDYQRLHTAIIRGVFGAREWKSNVDRPRYHKGLAFEGRCIRDMDIRSAGFVDWVVKYGTDLDVAAIGMAIPSQTMRGWLSTWTGNFDTLWDKFSRIQDEFRRFIDMPGDWWWIEDDVFKVIRDDVTIFPEHLDVLAVDPPRLSAGPNGKDAYSVGAWQKLNATLGGSVRIKPWTNRNYDSNLCMLLNKIQSDYILFSWTEGNPPLEPIKDLVCSYGTLEDEAIWESHNKIIHGWWINRKK